MIILVLPVPTVLSLQMSTRRKLAVLGVICFGSLAVITGLCRFAVQKQLISEPDTSYIMGRMVIVAGIEIEVAVVAVNLPALRSLFTSLKGSSHEPSGYQYGHGHRLSSLGSQSQARRGRRIGPRQHELGATLTGSEEELMRQGESKIHVVTNVDIQSHQVDDKAGIDIGFPAKFVAR